MLFNSFIFLFCFLPIAIIGFSVLTRYKRDFVPIWLILCSLAFYSWWHEPFLIVLLSSIVINFYLAGQILRSTNSKYWLWSGVFVNLGLLFVFKYAAFSVNTVAQVVNIDWRFAGFALPLGISFFTFQQLAFLIDMSRGQSERPGFRDYFLFVSFFPQLIAGPIVHHREVIPQLKKLRFSRTDLIVGINIFVFGLAKKVLIADKLAIVANQSFNAQEALGTGNAWFGVFAYTTQIYFDFSAYSEMAIGLGRMFGIKLPINFFSPYKASSIVEFWRRWHLTLTRFTTDYIYTPLALKAQRKVKNQRSNLPGMFAALTTFVVVGVWHGSGWNFIIFGLIHGLGFASCLVFGPRFMKKQRGSLLRKIVCWSLSMWCLMMSYVFFRSGTLAEALEYLSSLYGANILEFTVSFSDVALVFGSWLIVLFFPNGLQFFSRYRPGMDVYGWLSREGGRGFLQWRPNVVFSLLLIVVFFIAIATMTTEISEFIYFDF